MTTTELIELLKKYEIGGISKRPREISITINGKLFMGEPTISVNGTGDGIAGPEIDLNIDGDYEDVNQMTNEFPKDMEQLKPCPFCGSHNVIIRTRTKDAWVECEACKSKGTFISFTQDDIETILQTEAVRAWNMREVNADDES